MSVKYEIFQEPVMVYIRYAGHLVLPDITDALGRFAKEPKVYVGQPHFFDLSQVTSFDIPIEEFLRMLGRLADVYPVSAGEHLFIFYAPPGAPSDLAQLLRKPYDDTGHLVIRVAQTLDQALDILGQRRPDLLSQLQGKTPA